MKFKSSSFMTDRARITGLGSAKSGTKHFWHQRVSGLALAILTVFFVITLISLAGASYAEAVARIKNPVFGLILLGVILAGAYHMRLGMQVIIEDYVPGDGAKTVFLMLNTFFSAFVGLAGVYALIRITLGS